MSGPSTLTLTYQHAATRTHTHTHQHTHTLKHALPLSLLLTHAGKFDPAGFVAAVESLTAADVSSFVARGVKAPSFVTYGPMTARIPRFESVAARLA